MNVTTIEVSNHQAIGGFIILGIVIGVGVTFCYFKYKSRFSKSIVIDRRIHNSAVNESSDPSMVVI
jgi:hypothetical protein